MAQHENPTASNVRVGKDLLELVSSAMYVEPLTAYREYLQNAADSIDEARRVGLLGAGEPGRVDIFLDQTARVARIRDNGASIPAEEVVDRLLALGGSSKRGTDARGFRGVGRLAALGYAQYLTFRARAQGEDTITEMTWDGRRLRSALADAGSGDLASVVAAVVDVRTLPAGDEESRFFEVEIGRIVRQRGDRLLDRSAVEGYLAQIAPVPFADEFHHGAAIADAIRATSPLGELEVKIDGGAPIKRPHRDVIPLGGSETTIHELTLLEVPGMDGGLAAVAWFAHHDYKGAIPSGALVKGVRVRVGNIQIGDQAILEQIFPESRFNSWTVGEVHVLDRRIVPNGRRDEFEANAHYANLVNQLSPSGVMSQDVAARVRIFGPSCGTLNLQSRTRMSASPSSDRGPCRLAPTPQRSAACISPSCACARQWRPKELRKPFAMACRAGSRPSRWNSIALPKALRPTRSTSSLRASAIPTGRSLT